MSKYLFTNNATAHFGIRGLNFEPFLEGRRWIGVAHVSDELAKLALERHSVRVKEITEQQFEAVKKNGRKDSDSFRTIIQDPTRPLHAQYVEEVVDQVSTEDSNAIDLLLTEEEPKPKAKPKPAKRATKKK